MAIARTFRDKTLTAFNAVRETAHDTMHWNNYSHVTTQILYIQSLTCALSRLGYHMNSFFMAQQPLAGQGLITVEVLRSQTHHIRYVSSGRVIGPSQRPLPDNTQHLQQKTLIPPGWFEPATPASERQQTHALDRAATGTSKKFRLPSIFLVRMKIWNYSPKEGYWDLQTEEINVLLQNKAKCIFFFLNIRAVKLREQRKFRVAGLTLQWYQNRVGCREWGEETRAFTVRQDIETVRAEHNHLLH